ncbi:MAG: hypothetical protein P5694_18595, partial [Limnospira sp. PMC 1286.21]|uniref:hypothetical protein n=1 Tax=Limnospira sp. PMC 1286.21 TaxID=2981069 RepID=UPI0028E0A7DB
GGCSGPHRSAIAPDIDSCNSVGALIHIFKKLSSADNRILCSGKPNGDLCYAIALRVVRASCLYNRECDRQLWL